MASDGVQPRIDTAARGGPGAGELADDRRLPLLEQRIDRDIVEMEKRIRDLREDLAAMKRAKRLLSARRDAPRPRPALPPPSPAESPRGRWKEGSAANTLRSFVRDALAEAGRPLDRREILSLMQRAGVALPSANPLKRISKVMWESKEFESTPQGFWFADKDSRRDEAES